MSETVFRSVTERDTSSTETFQVTLESHRDGSMGDNKEVDNEIDSYDENILCRNRDRNRNRLIERIRDTCCLSDCHNSAAVFALGYLQSRLQEKDSLKFHHIITFILATKWEKICARVNMKKKIIGRKAVQMCTQV